MNERSGLRAQGLWVSYARDVPVVHGVDLRLAQGALLALAGPNGAGKSTLLKALVGLKAPDAGQVLLAGESLHRMERNRRARLIGYLPQGVHSEFGFTVQEVVAMGRHPYLGPFGFLSRQDAVWVRECMRLTEISELSSRPFAELSGGERQRVLLASVLAQTPRFLLLDEPTASLDLQHQAAFMELLQRFAREGWGILMVTHDLNLASQYCSRVVLMHQGRVVQQGTPEEVLTTHWLRQIYGEAVSVMSGGSGRKPVVFVQAREGNAKA